jgi:hypothetical protein
VVGRVFIRGYAGEIPGIFNLGFYFSLVIVVVGIA